MAIKQEVDEPMDTSNATQPAPTTSLDNNQGGPGMPNGHPLGNQNAHGGNDGNPLNNAAAGLGQHLKVRASFIQINGTLSTILKAQ